MKSAALNLLLPIACAWASRQESRIVKTGVPLSSAQTVRARRISIVHPERVRLRAVRQIPPLHWILRRAGETLGVVSQQTIGMTLRYGIFIREDHWGDCRLLVHKLAHVAQYERLGGFHGFLKQYLNECLDPGYPFGELEQQAKRAESSFC